MTPEGSRFSELERCAGEGDGYRVRLCVGAGGESGSFPLGRLTVSHVIPNWAGRSA